MLLVPARGIMHATSTKRAGKCMQLVPSARENACYWYQARGKMHATGDKTGKETGSECGERGIKHVISARRAGKRTRASHDVTA